MKILMLSAAVIVLAGCAQTEIVWQKPGATDRELARDSDGCRSQAYAGQGGMMGGGAQRTAIVYTSCMEGKGWKRVETPKP